MLKKQSSQQQVMKQFTLPTELHKNLLYKAHLWQDLNLRPVVSQAFGSLLFIQV